MGSSRNFPSVVPLTMQPWKPSFFTQRSSSSAAASGALSGRCAKPASLSGFGINDSPNWVGVTGIAGTRYRFSAWVRSAYFFM